ncbi:MAG: dienelactone hydrolase [Alphaproteobacteria bacterium]|nr:dienelactone hydrolase [Alphaproteobacteria bacterium]
MLLTLVAASAVAASTARSAGLQLIDVPADAAGPELAGAVWSPCAAPAGEVELGRGLKTPGIPGCPVEGGQLPLILMSHGYHGWYGDLHDVAETLADAGFVVAALNHPADTGPDMSHADELAALTERPADIKRLIDFLLGRWPDHAKLDPGRIGVLGFSRGGYTALALIGGEPDWRRLATLCPQRAQLPYCAEAPGNQPATEPSLRDPRIKAAVIADPAFGPLFTPDGLRHVTTPIQLWASVYSGNGMGMDAVSPANVATIDHDLPLPHDFHVVENATHFAFLAPCRPKPGQMVTALCLDAPGFDRAAFHRIFNAEVLAFFRAQLPKGAVP